MGLNAAPSTCTAGISESLSPTYRVTDLKRVPLGEKRFTGLFSGPDAVRPAHAEGIFENDSPAAQEFRPNGARRNGLKEEGGGGDAPRASGFARSPGLTAGMSTLCMHGWIESRSPHAPRFG